MKGNVDKELNKFDFNFKHDQRYGWIWLGS